VYHSQEICYGPDGPGFESRWRKEILLFSKIVLTRCGADWISYLIGNAFFSSGLKRPDREVNYSPSSAEVKSGWSFAINSPIRFHGLDRYKFTSSLYPRFSVIHNFVTNDERSMFDTHHYVILWNVKSAELSLNLWINIAINCTAISV
jgi:hypothetical protein